MVFRAAAAVLASFLIGSARAPSPAEAIPSLRAYESCSFPDSLQVTDVSSMPSAVKDRPVQSHGKSTTVPLLAGRRVLFSYPGSTEPYASAKVELLPEVNYAGNRKLLLDDFDDIVASDKGVTRSTRKAPISSFAVVGLDRNEIKGNTLGIYLLLDDQSHIATTLYLLNPPQSKIKTVSEYSRLRDTFLYNYTRCIRNNEIGKTFGVPH